MREHGLLLAEGDSSAVRSVPVPVVEDPAGGSDLILVLVRTDQMDAVLDSIAGIEGDVYDAAIESALADVQAALEIEDPWLALVTFFEVTASRQVQDRGLSESFLGETAPGRTRTAPRRSSPRSRHSSGGPTRPESSATG